MQRSSLGEVSCSIARTVQIVGEWWTPLILRDLFAGLTRFEDLRRDLGIASNVLTDRLSHLAEHGVVERRLYQESPPRSEYVLTEKGRALFPIVAALIAWGDRWEARPEGPPTILWHESCGRPARAEVVCSHCGKELASENVISVAGPGGRIGPGTRLIGPVLAQRAADLRRSRSRSKGARRGRRAR